MDVRLPDGTIIRGVPDGMSRAELTEKLARNGFDVSKLQADNVQPEPGRNRLGETALGAVRGVADIGNTLLKLPGLKQLGQLGYEALGGTGQREESLNALDQANKDSNFYAGGRLAGNIAATAPVGGILGSAATRLGAPALGQALTTGGLRAGGAGLGTRMAGGAITGAASAGLVNPDDALAGGAVGAAIPFAGMAASNAGQYLGQKAAEKAADASAKFARSAPLRETVKSAVEAGYVIPPNMVKPSFKNALIESVSGKQATSQLASVRNQDVTEKLTRSALGLSDDAPITKTALAKIRTSAGKAYEEVASLSPQAKADLEALKQARNDAQLWFNSYNRTASPESLSKAKEFRALSDALESNLEGYAAQAGKLDLIPALRDARKQIAKTYTVERALNDASGTINAKVLGTLYDKGKPLSDGLEQIGRFANAFPQINQSAAQMGSPAAHNLRAFGSSMLGTATALGTGSPLGLAAAALPYAGSAASRSLMFRKGAQEALANPSMPTYAGLGLLADVINNPQAQLMLARSAPVIAAQ